MDHLAAIKQTFFQECEEQLSELESGLLKIEDGNHDSETVNAVFRAVHSIKGGAAAFGFDDLGEFVHVFESTLDLLRSDALKPTPGVTKVLLHSSDILSDLVRAVRDDISWDRQEVDTTKASLEQLCCDQSSDGEQASQRQDASESGLEFSPIAISLDSIFAPDGEATVDEDAHFRIYFRPKPSLYTRANEALLILREINALGSCVTECNSDELPFLAELDPEGAYLSWTIELSGRACESEVRQIFEFVESDCDFDVTVINPDNKAEGAMGKREDAAEVEKGTNFESFTVEVDEARAKEPGNSSIDEVVGESKQASPVHGSPPTQATIRVDLDKVDRLINLVGELVINQAVLSQRVSEAGLSRASSVAIGLEELEQLTRDIQDSVMAIRAQPVKPIFQRMSRTVREAAAITKKSVRLIVDGEGTEVDKTVIERLTDPLTHMVRNAVDHGIESPEARIAAGKPEEGTLRLSAMHRSGRIVIEVSDDGSGINRKRVREIAVAKGLIPENAALSEEEVDGLIFLPGFSTNTTASCISGRGVGMDVVKRAIQALGGRISISSREGYGSTFSMSLPLTLAVLDGMVVTVANQTLIIPLTAMVETLQPKIENVHSLGAGVRVIGNRNSFLPLIDVGFVLRYRCDEIDPTTQVALVVESESGEKCALLVDAIQGQRQVVIKSLEANYGRVHGIAAATILGDGRVALIVDVDAIVNRLRADTDIEAGLQAAE
ncbi:chemotaxis protein CheA [Methylocystis sp. ATCC 49242]|uniref:chemotaxis protein CheA n=1 Tax=Methylocystis sp. ATCC 49242 TaxID=622637 RepID=UPI0001F875A0|nr:chemotaxis protein CheA [Methylocystis sp. ATCC 49242]